MLLNFANPEKSKPIIKGAFMELFTAYSIVDNFKGFKNVHFYWFCSNREQPPAPFHELINNYNNLDDHSRFYAEQYILELFTREEIESFRQYLKTFHNDYPFFHEVSLPIPDIFLPRSATCFGPSEGFIQLFKDKNYNLPFKVEAYYDLGVDLCYQVSQDEIEVIPF